MISISKKGTPFVENVIFHFKFLTASMFSGAFVVLSPKIGDYPVELPSETVSADRGVESIQGDVADDTRHAILPPRYAIA